MTAATSGLSIVPAQTAEQIARVRELFLEYAHSLGFSLCFQSFDKELAELPGDYSPPDGRLLLAYFDGELAGCVAMHPLVSDCTPPTVTGPLGTAGDPYTDKPALSEVEGSVRATPICEMKRLYVRPKFRGKKIGFALATTLISEAREAGYRAMRLDTVAGVMDDAIVMYRRLGFREVGAYRQNPIVGALYMELSL